MSEKKAMVLAAGLGTRLAPYSLVRPKPLFPVLDKPILLRIIMQLRQSGFAPITVNAHHLQEQFVHLLSAEKDITLQVEDRILGTGGGLRLACEHFGNGPVLVTNGDIFHDIDLGRIFAAHQPADADITMVLHDYPRFNDVLVDESGLVTGFGFETKVPVQGMGRLAFTGIQVVAPEVLMEMPLDEFYDIIAWYRILIDRGLKIKALVLHDHFWTDMGTPADYLQLHGVILGTGRDKFKNSVYIGNNVRMGNHVKLNDWVCIGSGAEVGDHAELCRVVVWDGAQVPAGANLRDMIVT